MRVRRSLLVLSEAGPEVTIIDCEVWGQGFIVRGDGSTAVSIEGFTIRYGCTYMHPNGWSGGGTHCYRVSATIRDCIIEGCVIGGDSGWDCGLIGALPVA